MWTLRMEWDGEDMLCRADDLLIAKCHEGEWVSLERGWAVKTNAQCSKMTITHNDEAYEYGPMPKKLRNQLMKATMEKPTVGPDGEPRWQPNGERQRYARRLSKEVPWDRVFVAACQVLRHRKVKAGEIGPDDGISPSTEEIANVIAWSDLRQLRLLKKIADGLIVEKETIH